MKTTKIVAPLVGYISNNLFEYILIICRGFGFLLLNCFCCSWCIIVLIYTFISLLVGFLIAWWRWSLCWGAGVFDYKFWGRIDLYLDFLNSWQLRCCITPCCFCYKKNFIIFILISFRSTNCIRTKVASAKNNTQNHCFFL